MLKICFPKEKKKSYILTTSMCNNFMATGKSHFLLKNSFTLPKAFFSDSHRMRIDDLVASTYIKCMNPF